MNNYEILGLQKGADISEVKKKFRALSKIYHPDMSSGNASKFIQIKEAYDALLLGNSGETPKYEDQRYKYQEDQQARSAWEQRNVKTGQFRFESIKKYSDGYLIKFYLKDVNTAKIYGKDGTRVGYYNVRNVNGFTNLVLNFEDAKKAEYEFKIVLEDDLKYAEMTYKVKPPFVPNWWQKILIKLKIKNYKN